MSNSIMISAQSAEVRVLAAASRVLLDVQTRYFDTVVRFRRDHACACLSVCEARRLREMLGEAIVVATESDPRQASLWPAISGRAAR